MRKATFILVVIMIMVQIFAPMSVSAAAGMRAEARASDPTVDGYIGNGEYTEPFVVSALNSVPWGGWERINSNVTYRFAWSKKGLYIAVTYDPVYADNQSLLQFVCNPGNQLSGTQEGLFFTIYPDHRVLLHNHRTLAGDASVEPYDLTNQVVIASKTSRGYVTTEVLLPIDAFRITDSTFAFSMGTMRASAVVMLYSDGEFKTGATVSSNLEGWDLNTIGLGTLTLLSQMASDTDGEDFSDSSFDIVKSLAIAFLVTLCVFAGLTVLAVIFTIVFVIVLSVRRKKRKKEEK